VRERDKGRVLVTAVDEGTEVANFSSYDRYGAFFDMLPYALRLRMRQGRESQEGDGPARERIEL
jgi:hypothetical protein